MYNRLCQMRGRDGRTGLTVDDLLQLFIPKDAAIDAKKESATVRRFEMAMSIYLWGSEMFAICNLKDMGKKPADRRLSHSEHCWMRGASGLQPLSTESWAFYSDLLGVESAENGWSFRNLIHFWQLESANDAKEKTSEATGHSTHSLEDDEHISALLQEWHTCVQDRFNSIHELFEAAKTENGGLDYDGLYKILTLFSRDHGRISSQEFEAICAHWDIQNGEFSEIHFRAFLQHCNYTHIMQHHDHLEGQGIRQEGLLRQSAKTHQNRREHSSAIKALAEGIIQNHEDYAHAHKFAKMLESYLCNPF